MSEQEMRRYDVIVVGAGVIGLTTARRLATGARRVALVDPHPARGASYAAAGMLAPVTEAHYGEEGLLELNLRAAASWAGFAAELEADSGLGAGYVSDGTLLVAADAGDKALLEELFTYERALGLPVTWCGPSRCREIEPLLAPGVRGGVFAAQDHQVDNRRLLGCLVRACHVSGVAMIAEYVLDVTTAAGRVDGVVTPAGPIAAPVVVLSAGWSSAGIGGLGAAAPPVRPVKGQILRLDSDRTGHGGRLSKTLRGVVQGTPVYVVPRADGRVVLGATSEELGDDRRVTAGGAHALLRDAIRLAPAIAEMELTETLAALRPGSPDNAPIVGPGAIDGLVLGTGHYRNGILLAPVTAEAIAALTDDGSMPPWAAPMLPGRFATGASREPAASAPAR